MAKAREFSFAEVTTQLDKGVEGADALRASRLDGLTAMRGVKENRLKREQARLAAKLGAAHPRVTEIEQQLALNAIMIRDLKLESARAHTEAPQVDENTWLLHGFVRNKELKGVPNLTVALFNPNGERIDELGHGCTDANGYFRLTSKNANNAGQAQIRVLSKEGAVLFADKNPVQPQAGSIDYREIILSGEELSCVHPLETAGTSTNASLENPPPPQTKTPPRDFWVVRGRVTDRSGKGLSGVFVSIYDEDLFFDDRLGQAETDAQGNYSLTYRTQDFRDLIERKPDLYLKVIDSDGEVLHTYKGHIWYESGRVETIDVVIP
jgi:hypothetical protein